MCIAKTSQPQTVSKQLMIFDHAFFLYLSPLFIASSWHDMDSAAFCAIFGSCTHRVHVYLDTFCNCSLIFHGLSFWPATGQTACGAEPPLRCLGLLLCCPQPDPVFPPEARVVPSALTHVPVFALTPEAAVPSVEIPANQLLWSTNSPSDGTSLLIFPRPLFGPEGRCPTGGHDPRHHMSCTISSSLTLPVNTFAKIESSTFDHCLLPEEAAASLYASS